MHEDDVQWLYDLCKKKYAHRYDSATTEGWFRNVVLKQPIMFLAQRTENAFCITMLSISPWLPTEVDANVIFICADDEHLWEAMKLLRSSVEWARARKSTRWRLSSDTEKELAPFARRIGASEVSPRYVITF